MRSSTDSVIQQVGNTLNHYPDWFAGLGLSDYVAVDVETTGLDARAEQIIEIGVVRFLNGKAAKEFQTFIACPRPLDPFITDLTGITDEQLVGAPSFRDIADTLESFIGDSVIVGQNIDFDLQFLIAAGREMASITSEKSFAFRGARVLDTAMLARIFWPEFTKFSLSRLCNEFGVSLEQAHRASADARATGHVLAVMIERLPQRVWRRLADQLDYLISATTHRSRFFFASLKHTAQQIDAPAIEPRIKVEAPDYTKTLPFLDSWFEEGGCLEQALHRFSYRPIQLQMARQVESALEENQFALIEAPTGTGKSLAYLIPALLWSEDAPQEERQVVISSHTKALQEQLFEKDAQDITISGGRSIRAAVLKGRRNYLCRRRLSLLMRDADQRLSDLERIRLMPLLRWAELTQFGDISEIGGFNEQADPYLWSQVCSDGQACSGSSCSSAKGDFHRAAQESAASANLVFVNHALLMSDANRFLLKPVPLRKIVIDEAHAIERAVVSAMTIELTAGRFRDTLTRIVDERSSRGILFRVMRSDDHLEDDLIRRIQSAIDATGTLHASVRQTFSTLSETLQSMSNDNPRSIKIRFCRNDNLHRTVSRELQGLMIQWSEFSIALASITSDLTQIRGEGRLAPDLLFELRSAADSLEEALENLKLILDAADENRVFWVEAGSGKTLPWCSLYAAPISIAEMLDSEFWQKCDSVILTSATLTTNGDFRHIRGSLGLDRVQPERVSELILESPFILEKQMRVIAPLFLPDPRQQQAHVQAIADLAAVLVEQVHRGTLILCTSLEAVRQISAILEPVARRAERILLSQRSAGAPHELLRQFRKHRDAILVGAASFWEGIDVIGDSLQILIIAKLPFDVPTEPWVEARSERLRDSGRDAFNEFSIPAATLRLKQGLGRLIRHQDDRGVAILCDPRLLKSRFGHQIRNSLSTKIYPAQTMPELSKQIQDFFHTVAS